MDAALPVRRWLAEEQTDILAVVEALADERIAPDGRIGVDPLRQELERAFPETDLDTLRRELTGTGLVRDVGHSLSVDEESRESLQTALDAAAAARTVGYLGQARLGAVLSDFVRHCRDELDDVEVLGTTQSGDTDVARLTVKRKDEVSRIELRHGFLALDSLIKPPTLLIGDTGPLTEAFLHSFAASPDVRTAVALYDLERLEKMSAVRSAGFVYFEWFLRDVHGVKITPSRPFTQALIDCGVISLGFG